MSELTLWRWDEGWRDHRPAPTPIPAELNLVTFNVWFDAHAREERCGGLAALLEARRPDVIALQEATLRMLEPLLAQEWVRQDYWCSASSTSPAMTHGVVLLARLVPDRLVCEPLPGAMGRRVLWADFGELRVATVHLESMQRNAPVRRAQLEQVFSRLREAPSAVLMGDFNFCSSWDENRCLDSDFADLWPYLHPHSPGWTEDTEVNTMRLAAHGTFKSVRFDRILLRSQRWRADSIELLGTEPLGPGLFCSDHFGLAAHLQRPISTRG